MSEFEIEKQGISKANFSTYQSLVEKQIQLGENKIGKNIT
jgi:hypothetical protein